MDDVDFVLGQYDEERGASKKGLYSSYHRSNTSMLDCE